MAVYSCLTVCFVYFPQPFFALINFCIELTLVTILLIYSVVSIRRTIKDIEHVFPNECFMIWHIANFAVIAVMGILNRVTDLIADRDKAAG